MAILYEKYTAVDNDQLTVRAAVWSMQSFTPSVAHEINSVKLRIWRVGSPGTLTVSIRATSGGLPTGSDLVYGTLDGNALTTDTAGEWKEIILGSGQLLSASTMYAIVIRAPDGSWPNHYVGLRGNSADVYAGGSRRDSSDSGVNWAADNLLEILFEEWNGYGGTAPTIPELTTEPATAIANTTATGNGTITNIGASSVTEHGHCWNTATNPTTANSKTTNGSSIAKAFTSAITGLTPGTLYYVRAYATNTQGTGYGGNISFRAGYIFSQKSEGNLIVKGTTLRYVGYDGLEYYLQGTAV